MWVFVELVDLGVFGGLWWIVRQKVSSLHIPWDERKWGDAVLTHGVEASQDVLGSGC